MSTVQAIDSADSLIPNGTFCQGLAYWRFYGSGTPVEPVALHEQYYQDSDSNVADGTPKYGMLTNHTAGCWISRNDLFEYPLRRYLPNVVAFPVSSTALRITAASGTFHVESLDYGTPYEATVSGGVLVFGLDSAVPMPVGTKLAYIPDGSSEITLQVTQEVTQPGDFSRSFGVDTTVADGDGTIYFYVKKAPEQGSTVVLDATDSAHSGYYTVDRVEDTSIRIVPQSGSLQIKAAPGDVSGILYNRDSGATSVTLRVFGDLTVKGVSVGDYFVTTSPARSYGQIIGISPDSSDPSVQIVSVQLSTNSLPETSTGQFVAVTSWAVSAQVICSAELTIPAVRYNMTLVFSSNNWTSWTPSLQFVKEEGSHTGESLRRSDLVIDKIDATFVREFDATTPASLWKRRVYKIQADRAVPIPGLPVIAFEKSGSASLRVGHVAMFKGDLTETVPSDDQQTSLDFDTLEYNTAPDGGVIPKGTVVPFIGGTVCPPGWKRVLGEASDGDTPSNVVEDIPKDIFEKMEVTYNYGSDVTTVKFEVPTTSDFTLAVNTGCGYNPWSNYKNLMAVIMRPPPNPPVMKLQVRNPFTGRKQTWFRARLPAPPPRPQRYAFVEVGLLKNLIVPGQILQLIPDKDAREPMDGQFFPVIGAVRVSGGFVAEEVDWQTKSYPSSYETLYGRFNIWSIVPSPLGIATLISSVRDIMRNVSTLRMYDPTEHGEPLPPVQAVPDNKQSEQVEIDLQGDWSVALQRVKDGGNSSVMRILNTGYVKNTSSESGKTGTGAPEHNHKVEPSSDVEIISGVAAQVVQTQDEADRPPVAVNHGHDYLGAGGYSRPKGRGVLMCIKL